MSQHIRPRTFYMLDLRLYSCTASINLSIIYIDYTIIMIYTFGHSNFQQNIHAIMGFIAATPGTGYDFDIVVPLLTKQNSTCCSCMVYRGLRAFLVHFLVR